MSDQLAPDKTCTPEEEAHDEMCPGCTTCLWPWGGTAMSTATLRRPAVTLTRRMTMGCNCLCLICASGKHCHNFAAGCAA